MIKISQFASLALLSIAVTACSGDKEAPEAENVTETKMDEVDVIDGTISDDMVDVDTQRSGDEMEEGEEEDEKGNGQEAENDSDNSE